ncbi:hypothetical protein A2U01_0055782, partial [Trifolium medium]|nr:hypothetical protein [Trifolium medium]
MKPKHTHTEKEKNLVPERKREIGSATARQHGGGTEMVFVM